MGAVRGSSWVVSCYDIRARIWSHCENSQYFLTSLTIFRRLMYPCRSEIMVLLKQRDGVMINILNQSPGSWVVLTKSALLSLSARELRWSSKRFVSLRFTIGLFPWWRWKESYKYSLQWMDKRRQSLTCIIAIHWVLGQTWHYWRRTIWGRNSIRIKLLE